MEPSSDHVLRFEIENYHEVNYSRTAHPATNKVTVRVRGAAETKWCDDHGFRTQVAVKDLKLTPAATAKFIGIAGDRYDEKSGEFKMTSRK